MFVTPWTAACQNSLSFTISRSLLKCMSIWVDDDLSWDEKARPLNRKNKPEWTVRDHWGTPAVFPHNLQSCSSSVYFPLPPPGPTDKAKKKLDHHYMNPNSFCSSCHFNRLCPIFFFFSFQMVDVQLLRRMTSNFRGLKCTSTKQSYL